MLYDSYNLLLKSIHNQLSALVILCILQHHRIGTMSNYCWLYTVGLHEDIGTDFAIMVEETTGQAPT